MNKHQELFQLSLWALLALLKHELLLFGQSISFVFVIKKIKKQTIFLMPLLKWPHWLLLLHRPAQAILGWQQ